MRERLRCRGTSWWASWALVQRSAVTRTSLPFLLKLSTSSEFYIYSAPTSKHIANYHLVFLRERNCQECRKNTLGNKSLNKIIKIILELQGLRINNDSIVQDDSRASGGYKGDRAGDRGAVSATYAGAGGRHRWQALQWRGHACCIELNPIFTNASSRMTL